MASEYGLHPVYKKEFHQIFEEHQEDPEFKERLVRMKVVDANYESAMDEDQWEAASKRSFRHPGRPSSDRTPRRYLHRFRVRETRETMTTDNYFSRLSAVYS